MVGRGYMLDKPSGPSAPKVFFDVHVVPLAVNAAGGLEGLLVRSSARLGVRPAVVLAGVASLLSVAVFSLVRRRDDAAATRRAEGRYPA